MKSVILCADDYAASPEVSEGIRLLVKEGRLSAVSCMVTSPSWPAEAESLATLRNQADVGLHFNLTLGFGELLPKVGTLVQRSLTGRIDRAWVRKQLQDQLDLFEQVWGRRPDFVDGHQHVHVFPGIRRVFLHELANRYPPGNRPWLRRVNPSLSGHDAMTKALVLRFLAAGFAGLAVNAGFRLSGNFAGLYSLSPLADFPGYMTRWLQEAGEGGLIMCHPGLDTASDPDGIGATRWREWQYLNGGEFSTYCKDNHVAPGRYPE